MAPTSHTRSGMRRLTMTPLHPGTTPPSYSPFRSTQVILSSPSYYAPLAQESMHVEEKRTETESVVQGGPLVGGTLPSHCSRDEKEKLTLALTTILDLLTLYGYDSQFTESHQSTLRHWQICSAECGWIKFLKYKLAAFFSDFLDVELPQKPFSTPDLPRHLVGGKAGRFLHQLRRSPRGLSFATSILYSKKGMPRPDEQMLQAALKATKKVLTSLRPVPPSSIVIVDSFSWGEPQRPLSL
jgi:hypothetical protein